MTTLIALCVWKLCPVNFDVVMWDRCSVEAHGSYVELNNAILNYDDEFTRVVYSCRGGE